METATQSVVKKKERNFPELQLNEQSNLFNDTSNPILIIQSPKTPTLSRKQKAASLDSDTNQQKRSLDISRDVNSVPNTPKKQAKPPDASSQENSFITEYENDCISQDFTQKLMLAPLLGSNLKRFASNTSISGSQTLKTLPEVMTLQEFSGTRTEPVRIKAKGLLERRGSNASLTIDLGSNTNLNEAKIIRPLKLNTAKSVSNLNLTSFGYEKCVCHKCPGKQDDKITENIQHTKKINEKCRNCIIYESIPSKVTPQGKHELCKCNLKFLPRYYIDRHCVCNIKFRRKSLSNENLYVPPCNFCHFGSKDCHLNRSCNKGSRKALYPRQTYIETSQLLSEDFKLHLQNVQYLQTAGSVLSIAELKSCCQMEKIPRLHQEFWEVPLNLQEKCLVSGSQSRNRYKGVLPNEHSRVLLPGSQPYIHANYIKGPDYTETAYIATQGPMSHTCEDFWNMVWTNQVHRIVMLTALIERGRNKCELYFPLGELGESKTALYSDGTSTLGLIDSGSTGTNSKLFNTQFSYEEDVMELEQKNTQEWGPFVIKYLTKEYLGKCIIRKLELIKTDNIKSLDNQEKRLIYHYWYPNWADHKLANPEQVLKIALHVLDIIPTVSNSATDSSSSADAILHSSSSSDREMVTSGGATFKFDVTNKFNFENLDNFDGVPSNSDHLKRDENTKFDFNLFKSNSSSDTGEKMRLNLMKNSSNHSLNNLECKKTSSFESSLKDNNLFLDNNQKRYNFATSKPSKFNFDNSELVKMNTDTIKNPILVHCSAGIGRTGCFLAILNGIHQLRSNYNVDILAIVCSLRLNRGGMVQTAEQYELIHRVLSLYTDMI